MLKTKDIKTIETGPRQLTFGFEAKTQTETDNLVISSIKEQAKAHGQVFLYPLISLLKEKHDLAEPDSLQSVFWSAEELKIHFRIEGRPATPHQARKILLDSPDKHVELVGNKQVEASLFRELVSFYQQLMNKENMDFQDDQYGFSLSLLSDLKSWESSLASFAPIAQKPFYPGRQKINDHLHSLKLILARQDSYSLISKCFEERETIAELAGDIKTLSRFYKQQAGFWDILIQKMEEFRENLSELRQNPEAAAGLDRLTRILSSPSPWELIPDAEGLLKTLQIHNDLIVEEKIQNRRQEAQSTIDALIEKLTRLLDSKNSGQDLRNQYLYPLRNAGKKVQKKTTLEEIDRLVDMAEDMVDDALSF